MHCFLSAICLVCHKMVCTSNSDELEQYAAHVSQFTSQYGREGTISYTVPNIIGPPSQPGAEGDFASSAVLVSTGLGAQRSSRTGLLVGT